MASEFRYWPKTNITFALGMSAVEARPDVSRTRPIDAIDQTDT
jgi:hypothetical protein